MCFEALSSHFRGGDNNAWFGAEEQVHQRSMLVGEFVKRLVRYSAKEVEVSDDRQGSGARRKTSFFGSTDEEGTDQDGG